MRNVVENRRHGSLLPAPLVLGRYPSVHGTLRDYQHQEKRIFDSSTPRVHFSSALPPFITRWLPDGGVFLTINGMPLTDNGTEQVIWRMKMRSRTARGYKTEPGMLVGLMLVCSSNEVTRLSRQQNLLDLFTVQCTVSISGQKFNLIRAVYP